MWKRSIESKSKSLCDYSHIPNDSTSSLVNQNRKIPNFKLIQRLTDKNVLWICIFTYYVLKGHKLRKKLLNQNFLSMCLTAYFHYYLQSFIQFCFVVSEELLLQAVVAVCNQTYYVLSTKFKK